MKKTLNVVSRYCLFLIPLAGLVISFFVTIPPKYNTLVADVITAMLPMIFTIIVIALSLPSEKIYGVSAITFRRLRKDWHFSFMEMILITISIFTFYTISAVFSNSLVIWCLDFISVVYSVLFVVQEIPILLKNDRKLMGIVKSCWKGGGTNILTDGDESEAEVLKCIIQYLVLTRGVKNVYLSLNDDCAKSTSDAVLLDYLLSSNNDFMFKCVVRRNSLSLSSRYEYEGIDILRAIDISLKSLQEALSFTDYFNVAKIYGESKCHGKLVSLVSSLKQITDSFCLNEKFASDITAILCSFPIIGGKDKLVSKFKVEFLNAMIVRTLSTQEMWFLDILRKSVFCGLNALYAVKPYAMLLSMYFYFILNVNKRIPNELKDLVRTFLSNKSQGLDSKGESWYDFIQYIFESLDCNDFIKMLPDLLLCVGDEGRFRELHFPEKSGLCLSFDGVFDKAFVINCWIELVIGSEKADEFDPSVFADTIRGLSKEDQRIFAYQMNQNWFDDYQFTNSKKFSGYLKMYGFLEKLSLERGCDSIKCVCMLKDEIEKTAYQEEGENACSINLDFDHLKDLIFQKFAENKKKVPFIDGNVNLIGQEDLRLERKLNAFHAESSLNDLCDKFGDSFKKIFLDDFRNSIRGDNSALLEYEKADFKTIKRYQNRNNHLLVLGQYGFSKEQIEELNGINCVDVNLLGFAAWNDGAIKFNIECEKEKTTVRRLKQEEIDFIIDNECKVADELYEYNEGDKNKSFFGSRKEIYEIVKDKYFYVLIVFKCKLDLDLKNILYFPRVKNSKCFNLNGSE